MLSRVASLVALNQAGAVLWALLADEAMGRPLADLLNYSQSLSRLLLSPWAAGQVSPPHGVNSTTTATA
jgi:hypothetical protein